MALPISTVWKADQHTLGKLGLVKSYLEAWFRIVSSKNFEKITYVDGFAGPGYYDNPEEDFPDGSPIIALKIADSVSKLNNKNYLLVFNELNAKRRDTLIKKIKELGYNTNDSELEAPGVHIVVKGEEYKNLMPRFLDYYRKYRMNSPLFVFVDPFGFKGIPYRIHKEILSYRHSEILLNLEVRERQWCM